MADLKELFSDLKLKNPITYIQSGNVLFESENDLDYSQTKLNNRFFEKKLKVTTTTRNWKTILKLNKLSED